MGCKNSSFDCISIAQVRWNTKRLFNSNTGIFSRSWVEKNKLREDWINSFILREYNFPFFRSRLKMRKMFEYLYIDRKSKEDELFFTIIFIFSLRQIQNSYNNCSVIELRYMTNSLVQFQKKVRHVYYWDLNQKKIFFYFAFLSE